MTPDYLKHSTATDPSETLPAPSRTVLVFGDYEVVGELGEGGMGRVYKAVDQKLGRSVAIKVLRSTDPFECSRFRGEAEMIANLEHTNIVQIFAIDTTPDGRPYLVLEFAEGGSLDRELAGQPQEPRRAAEMIETLARAVHYAHQKGVIHRDLKPANVLRCKDRVLKLTDFGLAKELEVSSGMTPSGAVMGTPSYMAPEQAEGKIKQLGPTADVYGLGAILYETLTGRPPFRGVNMVDTLEQVRWAEPAPPSRLVPRLPRDLSTICLKCLQKSPGRRYQTAGELADDLRRWMNGETIAARPAPSWERAWRQMRRRPWEAATIAASVLLVFLMITGGLYVREKNTEQALRIDRENADKRDTEARQREQELRAALFRDHADRSLTALDGIRDMLRVGLLSNTPNLDPLKDKLFEYYEQLNNRLEHEGGHDRAKLARSWEKIGDLIYETGKLENALQAFKRANELYQADTTGSRVERARVLEKLGRTAFETNDNDLAKKSCEEALKLIVSTQVSDDRAGCEADVHHLQGELAARFRKHKEAIDSYERAIDLRKAAAGEYFALARKEPSTGALDELTKQPAAKRRAVVSHLRGLARGYGYLGDVYLDKGLVHDADRTYWQSHDIREGVALLTARLAQLPRLPEAKKDKGAAEELITEKDANEAKIQLARSWSNFASLHTAGGALGTAKYFLEQARPIRSEVSKKQPTNTLFRRDLCAHDNSVARLKILLNERIGVESILLESRNVPTDGGRESMQTAAQSYLWLAQFYAGESNRKEDARQELDKAVGLLDELIKSNPKDLGSVFDRAAAHALAAELGKPDDAPSERDKALARFKTLLAGPDRYRSTRPDDIERMPAFRTLKNDSQFRQMLDELRR